MMSRAKWFVVRKPNTGEIIATSANQIVPPKFLGGTKMLYYIHQTSWSVEGGSGDETKLCPESCGEDHMGVGTLCIKFLPQSVCGSSHYNLHCHVLRNF